MSILNPTLSRSNSAAINSSLSDSSVMKISKLSGTYEDPIYSSRQSHAENFSFARNTLITVQDFFESEESQVEQDIPLPGGYAGTVLFWKMTAITVIMALILSSLVTCFLNIADMTVKQWTNNSNLSSNADAFNSLNGEIWWIAVPTGGGLLVGLIRYLITFPETIDGMFKEIQHAHVEYKWAPFTYIISLISLSCGACLGPEAVMGNVGGAVGTFIGQLKFLNLQEDCRKLLTLTAMSSAFGAIVPSPIQAVSIHNSFLLFLFFYTVNLINI